VRVVFEWWYAKDAQRTYARLTKLNANAMQCRSRTTYLTGVMNETDFVYEQHQHPRAVEGLSHIPLEDGWLRCCLCGLTDVSKHVLRSDVCS